MYLRVQSSGSIDGSGTIVEVVIDGDWMWAISGDEIEVPHRIGHDIQERMEKGEVFLYRQQRVYSARTGKLVA